ncbi:MAG TPA: GNAT family N-acetyltransferase [Terriglobia bacterium]|nr:GNAT family N-acetyltransferase [Terriglobia bacterium]
MKVRRASIDDCDVVGTLVFELINELSAPKPPGTTKADAQRIARELMSSSLICAFLAESDAGEPAGVLTLNGCAAIYAGGSFGEITEIYVRPGVRSEGVGAQLIQAAIEFGKTQGWTRLEVCAPPAPAWDRSIAFYLQNGFLLLGPRLKRPLG